MTFSLARCPNRAHYLVRGEGASLPPANTGPAVGREAGWHLRPGPSPQELVSFHAVFRGVPPNRAAPLGVRAAPRTEEIPHDPQPPGRSSGPRRRGLPQTRACGGLPAGTSSGGGGALAGRSLLWPARTERAGQLSFGVDGDSFVLRGPLRPCRLVGI